MILGEAIHALSFGLHMSKVQFCSISQCALTDIIPIKLDGLFDIGRYISDDKMQINNMLGICILRLLNDFLKNGLCCVEFVYNRFSKIWNSNSASGRSISRILSSGFLRLCDHLSMQSTRD